MGYFTTFDSNCTIPQQDVSFVSAPYIRGTLDIVWTCATVLLICTWSVLHLNIPISSTPSTSSQKYVRITRRTLTKATWMLFNLLAPEWPLAKALSDRLAVKSLDKDFEELSKQDEVPWSASHTYFANMGGFVIKFPAQDNHLPDANCTAANKIHSSQPASSAAPSAQKGEEVPESSPRDITQEEFRKIQPSKPEDMQLQNVHRPHHTSTIHLVTQNELERYRRLLRYEANPQAWIIPRLKIRRTLTQCSGLVN